MRRILLITISGVLLIGVVASALLYGHRSAQQAQVAAATAAQVQQAADKAAADRASADKLAADKVTQQAHDKQVADAAAKKALADKAAEDKKAAKSKPDPAPRIIVRVPTPSYHGYSGAFGTFGLTALARPGPIHVYDQPSDNSAKLYRVYSYESVTVYCSVHGRAINGHDYWDWTGDGWIWDKMVEIGGHTPPPCID
jgi:hypothetical protein